MNFITLLVLGLFCCYVGMYTQTSHSSGREVKHMIYDTNYTSVSYGNKFRLGTSQFSGHVLFFLRGDVCYACKGDIYDLQSVIDNKSYSINAQIIVLEQSQEYANQLKNVNKWNVETIGDQFGTYARTFGIKNSPCFVGLDSLGCIVFISKLASAQSVQGCIDIIRQSNREQRALTINTNARDTYQLNKVVLRDSSGKGIIIGAKFDIKYLKENKKVFILDKTFSRLYIADATNGQLIKQFNLIEMGIQYPWSISAPVHDSVIYVLARSYMPMGAIKLYQLFLSTGIPKLVDLGATKYSEYQAISATEFYDEKEHRHFFPRLARSDSQFTVPSFTSMLVLKEDNKSLDSIGMVSSDIAITPTVHTRNKFDINLCFDNTGNVYELQMYSKTLHKYGKNLEYIGSYSLSFDTSFKHKLIEMPEKPIKKDYFNFEASVSHFTGIWHGNQSKKLYISYSNFSYPDAISDEDFGKINIQCYLHITDENGRQVSRDKFVTQGGNIFFADEDIITVAKNIENRFIIESYVNQIK